MVSRLAHTGNGPVGGRVAKGRLVSDINPEGVVITWVLSGVKIACLGDHERSCSKDGIHLSVGVAFATGRGKGAGSWRSKMRLLISYLANRERMGSERTW